MQYLYKKHNHHKREKSNLFFFCVTSNFKKCEFFDYLHIIVLSIKPSEEITNHANKKNVIFFSIYKKNINYYYIYNYCVCGQFWGPLSNYPGVDSWRWQSFGYRILVCRQETMSAKKKNMSFKDLPPARSCNLFGIGMQHIPLRNPVACCYTKTVYWCCCTMYFIYFLHTTGLTQKRTLIRVGNTLANKYWSSSHFDRLIITCFIITVRPFEYVHLLGRSNLFRRVLYIFFFLSLRWMCWFETHAFS